MSSLTGYLTSAGIDLSFIFQSGNSGLTTGYTIYDGRDIGSIFQAYTSYAASLSGLISQSGTDISTLFEGISPVSPLTIIPGCCLWLDATDTSTMNLLSGKVSQWRDKTKCCAFVFNQTTDGYRPTYTANSQNSLSTLTFSAAGATYLLGPSNFSFGLLSYSLFVVCNITVANNLDCGIFNKSQFSSSVGRYGMLQKSTATVNSFFHHQNNAILADGSGNYPVSNYRILEFIVNRGENMDYSYQNGTLLQSLSVADTTAYAFTSNVMLIGAYNDTGGTTPRGGYYLTGNVAEVLSYKGSDMTTSKRQKVEGYLAWKWGIQTYLPDTHAYRYNKPVAPPTTTSTTLPLVIPGCCLWLDATDTTTIDLSGTRVKSWADKSTYGYEFFQKTNDNRPTYTNTQNGLPVITFAASGSNCLHGSSDFAIGLSSYSLFVVCNIIVANNTLCGIFNKASFSAQNGRIIMIQDTNGMQIQYTHNSPYMANGVNSNVYTMGKYRLLELIVNRTESVDYAYQNGTQISSLTYTDTVNHQNIQNAMLIGAYNDAAGTGVQTGYFLTGNVAEIVSYKGDDLTTANRQRVEGYLAWKWGIQAELPAGHPYRNLVPT